ncbi:MAG: hypothetical protein AAGD33_07890 [Actinomycetota bacterium]
MAIAPAPLGDQRPAVIDVDAPGDLELGLDDALTDVRNAGVATLHHRKVGILAIAPSGVHVISDAVRCGRVERRFDSLGRNSGFRLLIDGRDRSKLVRPVSAAAELVRDRLRSQGISRVPVAPHLCVSGATWNNRPTPFQVDDVTVIWPAELSQRLLTSGGLADRIDEITSALA